ncbi:MAG: hypothetical protein ACD_78C00363G0002 [uncultured bacterium (gcode 4)]|uniref:Uncharacterized protein n=1 Tax=uncultured bacterium (gcode 4) TaxID=1234023 RepID=K1XX76_9BACT|nr:MAG: hypothetical protein ACD_78C00363G0002 [uncultured bacterium (gcode 4)]
MEHMNTPITIIGSGYVWKFVSQKLLEDYSVKKISAREIWWVSGILTNRFADKVAHIFSDRETVRSVVEKVKNWERVVFAGKTWPLLDQLVHTIETECPEQINHFYILWANGFQLYGDAPRLVLNHAIKEEQIQWEKSPTPFTHSRKSYLYQPNPSEFDEEFVKELGFDVELTSDKNVFLKALYLKCCINTIYNSICISNGPYIEQALQYFSPDFIDKAVSELHQTIDHLAPGILSEDEIQQEIDYVKEQVPHAIPSSVRQFWRKENGRDIADYQNSDVSLLLAWILRYAQKNNIETPTLLNLMEEILWRGNRYNWAHNGPDWEHLHLWEKKNRTWFAQPAGVNGLNEPDFFWINTGVK